MKSLLFIGFDFHRKTGSVEFILDLLRKEYDVTVCWIDLFQPDPWASLNGFASHYDVLVSLQALPPRAILNAMFTWHHAALFPMYDGCPAVRKVEKWYPYRDFNIICFSRILFEQLTAAGFCARYIQYFPEPAEVTDWGDPASAFLWARREEINCTLAERLMAKTELTSMHVHKCPDPGTRFISPPVDSTIRYTYSEWFPQKSDMSKTIARSAYYFAPRQKEGIGHSFLEAMAMGRCVIAPNNATMNEYIEHGKTGFLYNLKKPRPLNINDVRTIQRQTVTSIRNGHLQWEQNKHIILEWLTYPAKISKCRILFRMLIRFFKSPIKVLRSI